MIASFQDEEAERTFDRLPSRRYGMLARVILRKLLQLNATVVLDDLKAPPGNHLELLRGDRKGQYSIRVNRQFRICFEWRNGNAHNVEIADYHEAKDRS